MALKPAITCSKPSTRIPLYKRRGRTFRTPPFQTARRTPGDSWACLGRTWPLPGSSRVRAGHARRRTHLPRSTRHTLVPRAALRSGHAEQQQQQRHDVVQITPAHREHGPRWRRRSGNQQRALQPGPHRTTPQPHRHSAHSGGHPGILRPACRRTCLQLAVLEDRAARIRALQREHRYHHAGHRVAGRAGFGQSPRLVNLGGLCQRASIITGFTWLTALSARELQRAPAHDRAKLPSALTPGSRSRETART